LPIIAKLVVSLSEILTPFSTPPICLPSSLPLTPRKMLFSQATRPESSIPRVRLDLIGSKEGIFAQTFAMVSPAFLSFLRVNASMSRPANQFQIYTGTFGTATLLAYTPVS
jgi:hypothetical protein